ncbi:amidohydrolase [Nesterenkonia aerolata]|uniref:Amidohydrolase n=1 Tax=Nesterenkonia aerolata TaxID=3074079 RepID=A0ABU2DRF9_9MICC|nr:amidohydrolase [Nesterenkonia sp. LY-0111]MDR8019077.1 amidohydrolase [Nesterenkonia sp. LY-0111]
MAQTGTALSWRHQLHQLAETAFEEHRTAECVAEVLRSLGLNVTTGIGGTGVVGTLTRGTGERVIGLRADMDGLAIHERTGLSFASRHEGRMHACGHDGHMAMVLGAAAELIGDELDGTVHFVFQPAEEPGRGAEAMVEDGLFERFPMEAIFGLHNMPGLPAGMLATRSGPIMAGEDNFAITVTGRGGHASAPHHLVDPLVVGAHIIVALQSIVSRSVDPVDSAVLSCTDITTDGARNAVPSTVRITGDVRNFDPAVSQLVERRLREVAEQAAQAYGAVAEVSYTREFATTVNHPQATASAVRAAERAVGEDRCDAAAPPIMASEDFGVFARYVPANFTLIGNGANGEKGGVPLHSHDYEFDDGILPVGIRYYRSIVHDLLTPPRT